MIIQSTILGRWFSLLSTIHRSLMIVIVLLSQLCIWFTWRLTLRSI